MRSPYVRSAARTFRCVLLLTGVAAVTPCAGAQDLGGLVTQELGPGGLVVITAATKIAEKLDKRANRAVILAQKTEKLADTYEITRQKERNDALQRTELAKLATTLGKTYEAFAKHYEKFKIVTDVVRSLAEARRFADRVGDLIEAIEAVGERIRLIDGLQVAERTALTEVTSGMIERAGRAIDVAALALLDNDTDTEATERMREEHGDFFVLMSTLDRTEQIAALNRELVALTTDLYALVRAVDFISKNRTRDPDRIDAVRAIIGA